MFSGAAVLVSPDYHVPKFWAHAGVIVFVGKECLGVRLEKLDRRVGDLIHIIPNSMCKLILQK